MSLPSSVTLTSVLMFGKCMNDNPLLRAPSKASIASLKREIVSGCLFFFIIDFNVK